MNKRVTWKEVSLDASTHADTTETSKTAHRKRNAPHIAIVDGLSPAVPNKDSSSAAPAEHSSTSPAPGALSAQSPIVALPQPAQDARSFTSLSKREGVVLSIEPDEFTARLTNLLGDNEHDNLGDLEATFAIDEVSRADMALLRPGAIFYWNIGYYDDPSGQRHRVSDLRFRRMPALQRNEIAIAREEARRLRNDLGLDQ